MAISSLVHPPWNATFSIRYPRFCYLKNAELRRKRKNPFETLIRLPSSLKCTSAKEEDPVALRVAISGVTELLRVFSKDSSSQSLPAPVTSSAIEAEDIVDALRSDYTQSYFLTGDFTDALYTENCFFADPTVQFSGRDLYKRNLKLLVPFYEDPSLTLDSIKEVVDGESKFIQAFWRLRVYLKLPWKPFIAVDGSTIYNFDSNAKIVKHVESWNISGMQAIGQLFKPSERAFWRKFNNVTSD